MWWCRTFVLLVAVAVLGGCGFRPLYGGARQAGTPVELAAIAVKPIADRIGQQLHNHLLDLLTPGGRPRHPRYSLSVELSESIRRLAVQKSEFATRANLSLNATYNLTDMPTRETILEGRSVVVTSFNILSSEFATLMAEKDARTKVVRELGDDIRTRIAVFFVRRQAARK